MLLEIRLTIRFGLEYYRVIMHSGGREIALAEFMSHQGASTYVKRLTRKTSAL